MASKLLLWRLAAPLRFLQVLLRSPRQAAGTMLVFLSESRLYPFNRLAQYFRFGSDTAKNKQSSSELSWREFNERVLANRDKYKGLFIQEPVIPWAVDLYQRPQHMASTLGELGYLVIYRCHDDGVLGVREVAKNVWITPRREVSGLQDAVHSFYSTSCASDPSDLPAIRKRSKAILYEYIDHIDPKISGDPERIRKLTKMYEAAKHGAFDYVVCSAQALRLEMAEHLDTNCLLSIPNGVDVEHYRSARDDDSDLPDRYRNFCQQYNVIIGYFGALAPWLWYDMLEELIGLRGDLGFVFIGPDYYSGVGKLPIAENVLWLDAVAYTDLPEYARKFDVAIIPFEPGDIARKTSPLKLFEYFALEKPVVCSQDMSECIQYEAVLSGDGSEAFSAAIDKAYSLGKDESFKRQLGTLAEENDWLVRMKEIEKIF